MQKQVFYTVTKNVPIAKQVYQMDLQGDTSCITAPGQFVNIRLDGKFLRRPISVCDWDAQGLTIIYKVVGAGTQQMSEMAPGTVLDTLSGLGNGYTIRSGRCAAALRAHKSAGARRSKAAGHPWF